MAKSTSKLFSDDKKEKKVAEKNIGMNEPVVEDATTEVVEPEVVNDTDVVDETDVTDSIPAVRNLDLGVLKKSRFNINGDPNNVLELNTRDMGIAPRLNEAYPRLNNLVDEVIAKLDLIDENNITDDEFSSIADAIKLLDNRMREELDYIFDAPVSEKCGADGNMWDPVEGAFRYEHIIDILSSLYENDLHSEFNKMRKNVRAKTKKFTTAKKYHR